MTEPEAADPRRADLGADAAGGADAVRHAAPARRRGLLASSTSPQARRDPRPLPPLHGAARRQGHRRGRPDARRRNASLSRLMIGAEPPQLQHREARAGAVVLAVREPVAGQGRPVRHQPARRSSFEVRAGEIVGIAGVSGNGQQELMAALSGEDARAPPRLDPPLRPATSRRDTPRRRRRGGLHFVPEERLGRGAVPTLSLAQNTLLTRTRAVGRGGWLRIGDVDALAEALIRALQRQGRRARRGGEEPLRRQPAEVHRRPRDRRRPEAADRLAADLGRRRRRRGADPRRAAGAARRRLRGAGGQRGARRAVRDLRPPARHRPGPRLAERADRRGHDRADRRVDERPLAEADAEATPMLPA